MNNFVLSTYSLISTLVLANSKTASEAEKSCFLTSPLVPTNIQNFFCDQPIFVWVVAIFTVLSIAAAAIAKFTGNLQKIIDFIKKNFTRKTVEVDDTELLKYRNQLLPRLQDEIRKRRENSLHELIQIDLEKEEQRKQLGGSAYNLVPQDEAEEKINILNRIARIFGQRGSQETELQPEQKIIDFYDREDIKGKLLILGEPGAGKTTELICLAKDLIERAIEDQTASIPIIFELSSWTEDLSIEDWLVEQLLKKNPGLPKTVAKKLLDNRQLIPLLDGLDELGLKPQEQRIKAINEFMKSSFQHALVVCCRSEEYEKAQTLLNCLNGAIYLRPLSDEQIQHYLNRLRLSSIWNKTIVNEPDILELVRKPLFLTMIVVAYQDRAIRNESELFEAYIEKQLNNPENQGTYPPNKSLSPKQILHYLAWLARKLDSERETEFLIEAIKPTWLESNKQKIIYRLIFGLIYGLIGGLIFGLSVGLSTSELENKSYPNQGIWNSLKNGLSVGLRVGLIFGLGLGLRVGLSVGLIFGLSVGLIFGLIFGLDSVIKHITLRLIIYINSHIPWNYAKFLDHAAKHRFIQRIGGRYRFMHDLLRKHFAQMPLS